MSAPGVPGIVHGVLAFGIPLFSVASAWRPGTRQARLAAWAAGACAVGVLALGVLRQRGWETETRATISLTSRSAGAWLDRKEHLGAAAVCFALCACLCAGDPKLEARAQRFASVAAAVFAMLAFAHLAFAHARVPLALVE